ncbi:MAG: hypothetical protein HY048_12300 [Acidobacteria bacterium]|nr:hypothetical protein [Acidobacteriota bacterium]
MFRIQTGIALAAIFVLGQVTTPPTMPRFGGNPEAAKIANPSSRTPESIAAGKRT